MQNDYDKVFEKYQQTHVKPDKKYSMLPTVLKLVQSLEGKMVVDVGCGDGFFSFAFAKEARKVYGIDNSEKQIIEAKKYSLNNTEFIFSDMFEYDYPKADLINVPFVLGYIQSSKSILELFKKFHATLNENGKIVGIIDAPKLIVHNNKKFGSIKKLESLTEGAKLMIELYNNDKEIITLNAFYHTQEVIEDLLELAGFKQVIWHKPIVSQEGVREFGEGFWKEYIDSIDIKYFTATI